MISSIKKVSKYDFIYGLTEGPIIYDIETYPNIFTFSGIHAETKQKYNFEISSRKNDTLIFCNFLEKMSKMNIILVGFNNIGFDYPVLHFLYNNRVVVTFTDIYNKAMSFINTPFDNRNKNVIWEDNRLIPQMDLFKIHHFDNIGKSTSLKVLEFNMRSDSVEGLPYEPGSILLPDQMDLLSKYNDYDVDQTLKFYEFSKSQIDFRKILTEKYGKDFTNHNDTKIGKDFFIMELEKHTPGCCYRKVNGRKKIMQTIRPSINLGEVVLPYIKFENPKFNNILTFFKNKTITETKGVFEAAGLPENITVLHKKEKKLGVEINNVKYIYGTGGIHGSIESTQIDSTDFYILQDWDVASYYPNISIANNLYPEHLGKKFCEIYKNVYEQRKQYKKGTPENAMLKLALNGVYGDSNNKYSPFYDSKYTMSITINGQLLLCMIVDQLLKLEDLQLIQINTDGFTIRYPRIFQEHVHKVMEWWENFTHLELENVEYTRMFIRDVNNYIAMDINGKIKRKGAYDYKLEWHQNHSALIISMAVSKYLIEGVTVEDYIRNHTDIFDFMLRTKIPKSMVLKWGQETIQNVSRYYISTDGDTLEKIIPAKGVIGSFKRKNSLTDHYYSTILNTVGNMWDARIHTNNKSKYEATTTGINQGWTVQVCNNIKNFTFNDLNYDYYIEKALELIKNAGGVS